MSNKSWVCRYIVPCPGNSTCKHCKPGEPHPQQHVFSKLVQETKSPKILSSSSSLFTPKEPKKLEHERFLRKQKLTGTMFGNLDQVAYDPKVDPQPYACFICWSLLHLSRNCQETATHIYCLNCGRKDVKIDECPRCSRAYRERCENDRLKKEERRKYSNALRTSIRSLREKDLQDSDASMLNSTGKESNDKRLKSKSIHKSSFEAGDKLKSASSEKLEQHNGSLPSAPQCSDKCSDFYDIPNTESNDELFIYLRNQKIQENLEIDRIKGETGLDSFSESDLDCYFYDDEVDENYEDYIVDENEKSGTISLENYTIRFFVDLLDALKHLSIDKQSTAIFNFVSARKKQICQK